MKTLEKIAEKYTKIQHNSDNFGIGGGLVSDKFASRRHEDAKNDEGKLTLGKANQMFSKATGLTVDEVSEIIKYAVPYMEWHHAGKLPKNYGGGMKKTYFLNAQEIVNVAENFADFKSKLYLKKEADRKAMETQRSKEEIKLDFLKAKAEKITRVTTTPEYFYETDKEMNGKYGWFSSYGKSYNMTEYYTGWKFQNQDDYLEFCNI
jgi:hypothetical protein